MGKKDEDGDEDEDKKDEDEKKEEQETDDDEKKNEEEEKKEEEEKEEEKKEEEEKEEEKKEEEKKEEVNVPDHETLCREVNALYKVYPKSTEQDVAKHLKETYGIDLPEGGKFYDSCHVAGYDDVDDDDDD